jgi:two-component system LytT family response regulator
MTEARLRAIVVDDERPARLFLLARLRALPEIDIVGEAANGGDAVQLIERERPDVVFLDLQMPEIDGLGVVRMVRRRFLPLVIFVTAYDEYAVKAFDLNAVDYLTKPVSVTRLREAVRRAQERLERADLRVDTATRVRKAVNAYERLAPPSRIDRIPVRAKGEVILVPIAQIGSVVADGELLHLTTVRQERFTITYRLKDLEARLDPAKFIRLSRGAIANVDQIARVTLLPGGMYTVRLHNGQELDVSRIQSRLLRGRLLQL